MDAYPLMALVEHYRNPRNSCRPGAYPFEATAFSSMCGDRVSIGLRVSDGLVEEICFAGEGCVLSQAAASMLTEEVKGKAVGVVRRFGRDEMLALLGFEVHLGRLPCALVALDALSSCMSGLGG